MRPKNDAASRIAASIAEYDAQGWHRTGTAADAACARWLAGEATNIGMAVELETFALNRFVPGEASIRLSGRTIAGLPLFDGAITTEAGICGRLGPAGGGADIGLVVLSREGTLVEQLRVDKHRLERQRATATERALVVVTLARRPGLEAINADAFESPYGPPVLVVGSRERALLEEASAEGAIAHVVVTAERVRADSSNVVATWRGQDAAVAPVIVTTPRSGWWHCASERGGGIAAWLEIMRRVAEERPRRPVWFVAFSGHELGHLGANAFHRRRPDAATAAHVWIHLGANIGAVTDPSIQLSASTQELLASARRHLEQRGIGDLATAPAGEVSGLESADAHARGGRVVCLLSPENAHFHLQSDRWPEAVDVAAVAQQANALAALVLEFAMA